MKKESLYNMDCFKVLGISPTKDRKIIRHAYASLAKKYNLETDADEIEKLKSAYDSAMAYAKEEPAIEDIVLSYDKDEVQEEQEEKQIFYKSESLWENYEKTQYEKMKELPGLKKIEKDIDQGHIFSFAEGREYVMSHEFILNQYEESYMRIIFGLFKKYLENLVSYFKENDVCKREEVPAKFFLPFAFMYGWDSEYNPEVSNSEFSEFAFLYSQENESLKDECSKRNFYEVFFDIIEGSSLLKREEVIAFSENAKRFHALTAAYRYEDKEKQDFFWSSLWQYGLSNDVIPVVKVKNDFSFWSMLTIFLEIHKDLNFNAYIELEKWFDLYSKSKSSKKHIFKPITDRIEENTGFSIETINILAMLTKGSHITGLRDKVNLSSYLKENKLSYPTFKYLYELYYFVPEYTEEEQKVMNLLYEYKEFESYYWEHVQQDINIE